MQELPASKRSWIKQTGKTDRYANVHIHAYRHTEADMDRKATKQINSYKGRLGDYSKKG